MIGDRIATRLCAALAAGIVQTSVAADWYGKSLDTDGHAQWNDAENWDSATGVPKVNINFTESVINGTNGSKTVWLDNLYNFSGDYHLYAGTEESPLVFKSSGTNGFSATANKQMYVGNGAEYPAYVVLDGGTYTFMNDLNVGWNQSDGHLVLKSGTRVQLPNWAKIGDGSGGGAESSLTLEDGSEFICGWRNNAESDNSRFAVAAGSGSHASLTMNGGRLRCSGGGNARTDSFVLGFGGNSVARFMANAGTVNVLAGDVRMADASGSYAVMTNNALQMTVAQQFAVASANGGSAEYVQNGGSVTVDGWAMTGRHGGSGTFIMNGGDFLVKGVDMRLGSGTPLGTSAMALNGGTFTTKKINAEGGASTLLLNGGVLKAYASDTLINKAENFAVTIGARGAIIDTDNYFATVAGDLNPVADDPETVEVETDGGLAVRGRGILKLAGAANYSGVTTVEKGVLDFRNGMSFTGPLAIGRQGAVTVEMTPMYSAALEQIAAKQAEYDAEELAEGDEHQVVVPTVADLLLDKKVELFSASALSFEEATDDLSTSVFLTGPVVGYTLSREVVDGRTVVYATITNVDNIATTRKVTSYIATDNYVDQDGAWSNGQPADNSYDVGIFCDGGIMHIWGNGKGTINNRKFGAFVVRGCTAKVRYGVNGYPDIGVKHVAGNGTLELAQAGLVGNGTLDLVTDKNVKIVITTEGASGTARDAWIGVNNANSTAATIVNGDVVTSNGFVAIWRNVTLNGDLVISPWSVNSYVGASAGDTLKINGDLVLLDGATFDFQSHNVTFGENARLVLMGGTAINTNSLSAWPATVIAGGVYTYGAVPGASEYTIEGGRLNVVPPTDGTSFELNGVTLADGVNAADVIKITGTQYNWTVAYDSASGKITATAGEPYDASTPNYWVGGAQGYWNVAANWSRGIPSVAQTVIFDGDALVYLDASKTVSNIVADAHVTFRTTNTGSVHPQVHFNEINGTGTLALYHAGLVANGLPGTIAAETTVEIQYINDNTDSWLEGRRGNGSPLMLYGKLTGSGYVIFRDDCHFYGDNSGFEGLVGMEWSDADAAYNKVFMTSESGFSGARRMNVKGKIGIGFKSGEISFGALKLYGFGEHHAINVVDGADVTINVGVGDYDVSLDNSIRFYSCTKFDMTGDFYEGAPNATLRKVGEGKISSGMFGRGNLDIAEGTCELTYADSNLNVFIREGAELYASSNVQVGGIAFEAGSKFMLPTLESTPVISAASATYSGVVVTLAEGLADTLLDQTDPNSYEMLNATGEFSGAPDTKVVAPCTESGYGWYARASGKALVLKRRNPIKGFYVRIR